jgi:8-oxo-dGTP pyrophosphatase MutT (NUDIX family)
MIFTNRRGIHVHRLSKLHIVLLTIAAILFFAIIYNSSNDEAEVGDAKCLSSLGTYQGVIFTKPDSTQQNKCLVESPWMRVSQHTVTTTITGTGDGTVATTKTIDDWLFIDYHDRINVLVEAPPPKSHTSTSIDKEDYEERDTDENHFIIMEQTKYALHSSSLAIVGGLIELSDVGGAIDAAKREVLEELSITCHNWKDLGKFRTDVNRGMGWVYPFLATSCTYDTSASDTGNHLVIEHEDSSNADSSKVVGDRDTEKQNIRKMSVSEVRRAVMDGKFVEVQWSNTVALAMLHLSSVR